MHFVEQLVVDLGWANNDLKRACSEFAVSHVSNSAQWSYIFEQEHELEVVTDTKSLINLSSATDKAVLHECLRRCNFVISERDYLDGKLSEVQNETVWQNNQLRVVTHNIREFIGMNCLFPYFQLLVI